MGTSGHTRRSCRMMRPTSFQRASGRINVGRPQPSAHHVLADEDVQRQVAGVAVIAVKEAAFLLAVHWIIGGVYIRQDAIGLSVLGLDRESTSSSSTA